MIKNSLLHPIDELHFGDYEPKDAPEALKATEKLAWRRLDRILHLDPNDRTFENTVLAFTRSTDEFDAVVSIISHLEAVLGEPWRKADNLATKVSSSFYNEINLHSGLYKALKEVDSRFKIKDLTKAQNKLLSDIIRDYRLGGIELPSEKKEQLKIIRSKLSKLTTKFGQNVVKANDKTGILVASESELVGLPKEFIKNAQEEAGRRNKEGYWLQYSEPNFQMIMSQCAVLRTRKAMYKAVRTVGLSPNKAIAREIISLRYELAKLLGYDNYSDYALKARMAKNYKTALSFIDDLINTYKPKIKKEHTELENFAKEFNNDQNFRLDISDFDTGTDWFYAQRQREKLFEIDENIISEYFPIEKVIEGMFKTLSVLYGVKFVKDSQEKTWNKDVEVYDIQDENGAHIAKVWCDWFARKNKHGGAWMNSFYVADRNRGKVEKPHLGFVVTNLTPPTKTKPSLLKFREVETIWHEFGHFMHLALARNELEEQSMMSIEWDFVEAPSQIFENWVWRSEILGLISSHYKTKLPIPVSIIKKLISSRQFRVASKCATQLILAKTDLVVHSAFSTESSSVDIVEINNRNKFEVRGYKSENWDIGMMNFTHVFAGGYASGYYSYKWAEAIEADFFEKFDRGGVLNPELGREYRDKILSRGAEVQATRLVRDFLGRSSNIKAMLRRDGINS